MKIEYDNDDRVLCPDRVEIHWAPWSGPARMYLSIVDVVIERFPNVQFAMVNVDEHADRAVRFGVRSIPATLMFKNGEMVGMVIGTIYEAELVQRMEQAGLTK